MPTKKNSNDRSAAARSTRPAFREETDPTVLPNTPIEQQMDMIEGKGPRGDEVLHSHGVIREYASPDHDPPGADELMGNFNVNMAEDNREGDEESGDDHSSGLQGEENELRGQPHIDGGIPGEVAEDQEMQVQDIEKKRAG